MNRKKIIEELIKYWKENDIPNISPANAKLLQDLIKIKKVKNFLEIWTANWLSAIYFWIELEKIWSKLTSIDFSAKSHWDAIENIKKAKLENTVKLILWNALDEIPKLEEKYDFVFIDGMKRRTLDFLELVKPKLEKEAIIIIDDVIKFKDKMIWLWDYLEKNNINFNIIPVDIDDGIMMIIND